MATSFSLQDHLTALSNDHDLLDWEDKLDTRDSDEVNIAINQIVDTITADSSAIQDPQVFDTFRSLLKEWNTLIESPSTLNKLFDSITSGFQSEIEATMKENDPTDHTAYRSHKTALEMYAFLLQWFVTEAEKGGSVTGEDGGAGGKKKKATKATAKNQKKRDEFSWESSIPDALSIMSKALRLRTERIWQTTPERDVFVSNCFLQPVNLLAEKESYMKKQEIRTGIYKVVCFAAKNHGQAFNVQMTIMQNLQYTEHLSEPMAELISILSREFDYSQLGEEVLREIAEKQFNGQDTKGPRSFSKFLIHLAEVSPRLVLKQIVVLQKHLDSESYPMRNAILEVIGLLIKELSITEGVMDIDPEQQKRQVESFFDLLFERFLDLNSYVRSKVVNVLLKIVEPSPHSPNKCPPKIRSHLTELALRSLEDKSSQVRKNCIALLTKLITTHPYGRMHGGELALSEWQERYDKLEEELKVLDLPSREEAMAMAEAKELMRDSDEEEGEGEGEGEEGQEGKKKKKEKEGEEKGDAEDEEEEEEEDEEEVEESDEDGAPKKKQKQKKGKGKKDASSPDKLSRKRPRKSDGMDLAAADQSQLLASLDQDTLTRLRLTKKYYSDAINFINQIEKSVDVITDLLASTVKSEVLEAMEFFRTADFYKIEAAEKGIKRMLHLIWSKDEATTEEDGKEVKGIRSRLIECYSQLYFEPIEDLSDADQIKRVAKNVIELTRDATLAELTSLEALLGVMMSKGVVSDAVIAKLWQVYSVNKEIPKFQRRGAIIVLGMFAAPRPDVVADHVETLLRVGLGPYGKADLILAKYTCIALSRVAGSVKKVKGSLEDVSLRLPMDSPVFSRLSDAIQQPSHSKEWFSMAEQALNTIYQLGDQPDALCSTILVGMTKRVFGRTAEAVEEAELEKADTPAVEDEDGATQAPPSPTPTTATAHGKTRVKGSAFELSQLIFVAGHCAIKQIVHLELVERDKKRKKAEADKKAGAKSTDKDELEQVAGSVDDEIGDAILEAKEKELLYSPHSLLAVYGPMAATIVSQPKIYRNPMLKTAATLALGKFMCVSTKFCEEHLMMLFKVLETSREPAVRSNIVIALGDIAVCFSTVMDQNSDRLYEGLHDKDLTVKKNTLMVLTHLILNGMIKVKGQLGEMAKCLEDEDKRISDLAHLFFTELSTKDKAIYNNLPDIISHLSSGAHPVTEETFSKSMKFIFTFIDKRKEAESIVEKLCQRFQMATEERQWRDIAYCLSLLPFNSENAVKKLVEGLPFYQDKLHEETVFKRFQEILAKASSNKATKNEQDLKEFADALEEHRAKGTEDQEMQRKVQKSKKKTTKAKAKGGRAKRRAASTPPSSPE